MVITSQTVLFRILYMHNIRLIASQLCIFWGAGATVGAGAQRGSRVLQRNLHLTKNILSVRFTKTCLGIE